MPASALFEDFSDPIARNSDPSAKPDIPADQIRDGHKTAFDDGYKEGWVDAQAATQTEVSEINADIAMSLQEAGFAYFEARQHIFNSMRPLLTAMIEQVMPELARQTLGQHVVEQLLKFAQETEPPISVLCAPDTVEQIKAVLAQHVDFPVDVRVEDTLTDTQALIQFTDGQASIDLHGMLENLRTSVTNFYDLNNEGDRESA